MKNELLSLLLWSSLCVGIAVVLAYGERGYFSIGGEWFAWIIPTVIHMERKY